MSSPEAEDLGLTPITRLKPAGVRARSGGCRYWRLHYHVVWATKHREPFIEGEIERVIARSIRTTLESFKAVPHAIGMVSDHVHVAVSIPPSVSVSEVVARMKGASAHAANDVLADRAFVWQAGYGVLSFGEKALPDVIDYVTHQRERHAANQLWSSMERAAEAEEPGEPGSSESARGLQPRATQAESPAGSDQYPGTSHQHKHGTDA